MTPMGYHLHRQSGLPSSESESPRDKGAEDNCHKIQKRSTWIEISL